VGPRAGQDDLGKRKVLGPPEVERQIQVPLPCLLSCVTL